MPEKRKFSRCPIKEKAEIEKEGSSQTQGEVFDVSIGGMGILLDKEIKPGSKLSGQFKIVPYLDPFFVQGEVVWMKPYLDAQGGLTGYAVGVKFTKVNTIPFE
jgi:hypothetical protein